MVLPTRGDERNFRLVVRLFVVCFPGGPCLGIEGFFLSAFVGSQEALCNEDGVGEHEEEGDVGDVVVCPPGLLLGILECVYVLGHPFSFQVEALQIILQRKGVEGVEATT